MNDHQNWQYLFEDFLLDCDTHRLLRDGEVVPLTPKELSTLLVFLAADGRAIAREAMIETIWPDTIVGDSSLARNISVLRRHLGAESIQLVPRFGYRFVPAVRLQRRAALVPEPLPDLSATPAAIAAAPDEPASAEVPVAAIPKRPHRFWTAAITPRSVATPVSALFVALLVAAALFALHQKRRVLAADHAVVAAPPLVITHLAILPFRNLSTTSAGLDYLRDGVLDDLIARMSQIDPNHLRVIGATTSEQYKDTAKSIATIGQEIGAQYVLEGAVDFQKDEVSLRANLVATQDATVVFSEVFEGPRDRLEAEEETIAERIGASPRLYLDTRAAASAAAAPATLEAGARDEYLRGRSAMTRYDREGYQRALEHFQRAVQLDKHYAQAYAGVAEAYIYRTDTLPLDFCYAKARLAALAAIALDSNLAEAHRDLGWLDFAEQNDSRAADAEFQQALRLAPQDPRAHNWYAMELAAEGRQTEAVQEARRAVELDPRSPRTLAQLGILLKQPEQLEEGIAILRRSVEIDPQSEMAWGYLGIACSRARHYPEAARAFDRAASFESFSASYLADAAYARSRANDPSEALRLRALFGRRLARHEWVPAQALAMTELALNNQEGAVQWVKKGLQDKTISNFELNDEPFYSSVLTDPYLREVVSRGSPGKEAGR